VEQGEKLSRVLLRSIGILNSDINLGRAEFNEIFMLIWWGAILGRNTEAHLIFKNSVLTSKKPQHFIITKTNLLTLFSEIITVHTGNCHNFVKFRISF
jgi:hypothetical protein